MIQSHEGKTHTPFGWFSNELIPKIKRAAGIEAVNGQWVFTADKVNVEKDRDGRIVNEECWIPVRAYNFEIHLLETRDPAAAISKTDKTYLPTQRDVSSYGILLQEVRERQGSIREIDWKDIKAKTDAFEQQSFKK